MYRENNQTLLRSSCSYYSDCNLCNFVLNHLLHIINSLPYLFLPVCLNISPLLTLTPSLVVGQALLHIFRL